ncbi:uncharacterized protein LOC126847901 isoform X2 [Adelges cooleyi]|uniref:uncharacterized protein LOC126847901 isoform X2 n=1 Tax=Adelges cooleyi TaxID=133065 RepID=UPI00217FD5C4|nr:uncharacterized protein LOC126847901 isoform X2 [Adelges cooleyi]
MVRLSYMFAAPAKAIDMDERNENYNKILQQCINSQNEFQKEINTQLDTFDSISFLKLEQERKQLIRIAVQLSIGVTQSPDSKDKDNFEMICRLKGVYRSILHPNEFIVEAKVNNGNKCHLTGIDNKLHEVSVFGLDLS